MAFNAQDYLDAAKERVEDSRSCFEREQYAVAHYLAGLAVECLLRAYRLRHDSQFDARHDLVMLRRQSQFYSFIPFEDSVKLNASFTALAIRWSNDDRFRSEPALRRKLKRANLDRGIKGDYLKANCRTMVDAALLIVATGGRRWRP